MIGQDVIACRIAGKGRRPILNYQKPIELGCLKKKNDLFGKAHMHGIPNGKINNHFLDPRLIGTGYVFA